MGVGGRPLVTRPRDKGKVGPERSLGITFVSVALVFHLGL